MTFPRRLASAAVTALFVMLAFDARAAAFKHKLLGANTEFDAIATGSDGTHIILQEFETGGPFYYALVDPKGKITQVALPFAAASAESGVRAVFLGYSSRKRV